MDRAPRPDGPPAATSAIPIPPSRRRRRAAARPAPRSAPRDGRRSAARAAARGLAARPRRTACARRACPTCSPLGDPRDPGTPAAGVGAAPPSGPLPHRRRRAGAGLRAARALAARRRRRRRRTRPASPSSSRARRRSRSSAPSAACAARATRCRASCTRTSSARPAFRGGIARLARELGAPTRRRSRARRRATCARSPPRTARTSSTSSPTSSACSTRAATARRCTTTARQLEAHLRAGAALPGGLPAVAQVEPRPPRPAVRPARERPSAEPHRRRHQHELLPGGPADAAQRRVLHPPHLQGQRGLQVRPAAVHRLPDREALLARVVHRGRPLALGQAAAAALRAARLRRRRLPPRQERGRVPDPDVDRLRPDPGRRRLRRRAARRARSSARASAGSSASSARLRRRYGDIHIRFGEPLSLAQRARAARSRAPSRRRRRAEPGAAEARVRGRGAHQPRDADHADVARRRWRCSASATARSRVDETGGRAAEPRRLRPPPRTCRRPIEIGPRHADGRAARARRAGRQRRRLAASPRVRSRCTRSAPTST